MERTNHEILMRAVYHPSRTGTHKQYLFHESQGLCEYALIMDNTLHMTILRGVRFVHHHFNEKRLRSTDYFGNQNR